VSGIAAIQSRIAEIQGRLVELRGLAPARTAATAGATPTATAQAPFAAALGSALATAGDAAGTSPAPDAGSATAGGPVTGPGVGTATGAGLVEAARKYLGVPYVWGGEDSSGMDCSGLLQRAFADLGVRVPRTAREQMTLGTPVRSLADAQPGDLIVQRAGGHIGIYAGNGRMIHAPQAGDSVKVGPIYSTPTAIRRVLPPTAPAATAASAGLPALTPTAAADAARTALALAAGSVS
jgi:cell wall-associated NlpC family hydrolase